MMDISVNDRVCFIEIRNSQKLNCLSDALCHEIRAAIKETYEKECCAIVLKAQCRNGVWSAGPDYKEGIKSFLEKRTPNYVSKSKDLESGSD